MSDAGLLRGENWFRRRLLSTGDLREWGPLEWRDWFAVGLDVWFSDWADTDRAFSFAPLRVHPDRDNITESLADYLLYFYRPHSGQTARTSLNVKDAIERGAIECMRSAVIVSDCARAQLLLEVFQLVNSPALAELALCSIQTLQPSSFENGMGEEYLSSLCYILFDNNVLRDKGPISSILEDRLQRCDNFRPALFYSLQVTDQDIFLSLGLYYDLTKGNGGCDDEDVWQEVSEEFDKRFGRSNVADAIADAFGDLPAENMLKYISALLPASRLLQFYPEIPAAGLFGVGKENGDDSRPNYHTRDITYKTNAEVERMAAE